MTALKIRRALCSLSCPFSCSELDSCSDYFTKVQGCTVGLYLYLLVGLRFLKGTN